MADRPSTVTVGPLIWAVDYEPGALALADKDEGKNRFGCSDIGKVLIRVDGSLPEDLVRETLFHEVIHAVNSTHGIDAHLEDRGSTFDTEERIVASLAPALLDVLRRNETLTTYLAR